MKLYLAGPMTGFNDHNFPAFHERAYRLRAQGYEVVNPAELEDGNTDQPWEYYLRRDLALLLTCEAVAVLPGWRSSKGASLEVHVAATLGMPVLDAETLEPETESILEEAQRIVHGARNEDYGHPLDNHSRTAALWGAYLGRPMSAEDVCYLNVLQKVSRAATGRITRDTNVDIAGYAANVEMVRGERKKRGAA